MIIIQEIILTVIVCIVEILETIFRCILCPICICILIIMQLLGLKDVIKSESWKSIWDYSMPFKFKKLYISKIVYNYLDPDSE